jgi:hypothetical protein
MMDYCKYTFKIIFTSHTVEYNVNKDYTVYEFINDVKRRISLDLQLNQNEFEIVCDERNNYNTGPSEYQPAIIITNEQIINKFGKKNGFYIRPINRSNFYNISECPICYENTNTNSYYQCPHLICSLCYECCNRVGHYNCSICRAELY